MKEIHHHENEHLEAANKIRAEAAQHGFTDGYLEYGSAPVRRHQNQIIYREP